MPRGTATRAALLAATMSFIPMVPVDIFRFLRVPAIVMMIRRQRGRLCHDATHRPTRWKKRRTA
ncbi:MAG TPA: hypothetical protein VF701_10090 [Thermoanaerobaculia bacterium]